MNPRIISALCLFLAVGFAVVNADEYNASPESYQSEDQFDEKPAKELPATNDEETKVIENLETQTSALAQRDESDSDAVKHKGFCHWGVAVWFKPGFQIRCSCLRCTCKTGGNWDCAYNFAYCPYYYCGNQIYNPATHLCCCGKVHAKKQNYACCGYYYYDTKLSKCCNYYSVKSKKSTCPRFKI